MANRKLHVWQPVTNLAHGQVTNASFNLSDEGLRLKLTDIFGNAVDIIYDKISAIQDYVWAFRYAGEIPRTDLTKYVLDAIKRSPQMDKSAQSFYKMSKSDFIEWFDTLPWLGSHEIPNVEHHIYIYNDGVFEFISDYVPKFVVTSVKIE